LRADELRIANDDLEGFSYSVSHDLRTPLRAIDGFASLIEQGRSTEDPQLKHHLGRIRENISRMSRLIDDLLAFARFGRRPIEMLDLRMDELVRDAASEACMMRSISLDSIEIDMQPLPCARGDRGLMLQVWINLLDNAVKYTSKVDRPTIAISGREEGDRLVYEVTDNGVGFDSAYSDKLFGVFERLHAASEYPGSGVGLAIVQRIVKRHGGEVWARSKPNRGATFGFSLPRANSETAVRRFL
jgi:light-regulated signal transduction histidine kinase (bacteriophytochrome)